MLRGVVRRFFLFSSAVFGLALLAPLPAFSAQAALSEMTAEQSTSDYGTGETVLEGNVRLGDGTFRLTADKARLNPKTQVYAVSGHVVLTRGTERLLADKLNYHHTDGSFTAENIRVGAFLRHHAPAEADRAAREVGTRLGLGPMLDRPAAALTVAGRKRLEVARALATEPKLLLLDEVMAGLNPSEVNEIVSLIRAVRDAGVTVLLIEHIMQAVAALAEQAHVLAEGALIASGTPREIAADPAVIEAYLGHGAAERMTRHA